MEISSPKAQNRGAAKIRVPQQHSMVSHVIPHCPCARSCSRVHLSHKAIFPQHQKSSPFHLNVFFFSDSFLLYFILFFIYFPSVSFSIWKVTWPLFPPSIFLLPLFSLGMKHRTRLKAFNGHSIGEEKSPSELY